VQKVEGIDNSFLNYGSDGVKTIDFILSLDFTEVWLPLTITMSSLIAGNDFRYDSLGENPKQNFTTYAEAGYTFEDVFKTISKKTLKNISVLPTLGIVFNNQAKYYTAGDYNKPSIVNMSLKASRKLDISKTISIPISIIYTHNAATKNTEIFGKNFLIFGVNFTF